MRRRTFLAASAAIAACARAQEAAPALRFPLRRGVNPGNALEAPREGEWGYRIEAAHLAAIAAAGFDGLRLPVRWDAHADAAGVIAPAFLARVREVVGWALAHGLKLQLDVHHYEALIAAPARERARFLALWDNIARAFADAPAALLFEPLNEPYGARWTGAALARLQRAVLSVIRQSNPTRLVVLGGPNWNALDGLVGWTPPRDAHTAVTLHYYEPWDFTHDSAPWLGAQAPRFGRAWGSEIDHARVAADAASAAAWARTQGLALQLGEFGVNAALPEAQRAAWLTIVRRAFEAHGIAWCAWDFAGAFPLYDVSAKAWRAPLLAALMDQ